MKRLFILSACFGLVSARMPLAYADTSLGFDVQGGVGTHGFDSRGSLDIKPDPAQKPWETSVEYSYLHTTVGTESKANQFTFGVSHEADENLEGHGDVTFWKDTINDIRYAGPTLGATYTWLNGGQNSDRSEIAAVTLDADLFFYTTDVSVSSRTVQVRRRQVILPGGSGSVHDTQFHPNLSVEKPLWDEKVTPYITAGHYFYSKDPAALESVAGRPRFAVSAGRLNSLVGGFLNNNGEVGARLILPWHLLATVKLGADQITTDNTWATVQDMALSRRFFERLKAKLEWTRTIQDGVSADLFSGGLTFYFD